MTRPSVSPGRVIRTADLGLLLICIASACGEKRFEPPGDGSRVAQAGAQFSDASFDSIQWTDREAMLVVGAAVYSATCRDCHGVMGEGDTDYARSRSLEVPSLVQPEWPYDDNLAAVRLLVFSGHTGGMPTHGIAGITLREIDAVSRYVLEQLRPEVQGNSQSLPPGR